MARPPCLTRSACRRFWYAGLFGRIVQQPRRIEEGLKPESGSLPRQTGLAVPFLEHRTNFRWIIPRRICRPPSDRRLRVNLEQPPDIGPRFFDASKVGAADQPDSECEGIAGVFASTPVCPFHRLLVSPRGQMREGQPATEKVTKGS